MSEDEVREAVEKLRDNDRLLDGEDPKSTDPEDAEHWVQVYGELLGFKDNLVGDAKATAEEADTWRPARSADGPNGAQR